MEDGAVLDLPMTLPNLERAVYVYYQSQHKKFLQDGRLRTKRSVAQNECTQHSSAVRDFCMGPSTGTGTDLPPVPVAHAGCVPCDAEARREASGAVREFFRIV